MDLVKKNLVSVICGVIIVIAMVALFWPISGYYQQLQAAAQGRKSAYDQINSLIRRDRKKPIVPTLTEMASSETLEPEALGQFPTEQVIKSYEAVIEQFKAESQRLYNVAVQLNAHAQLVPGALPLGTQVQLAQFRSAYKRDLPSEAEMRLRAYRANSLAGRILKAGTLPSAEDLSVATTKALAALKQATPSDPATGVPYNQQAYNEEVKRVTASIPEKEQRRVADEHLMYIEPGAMAPYATLTTAPPAAVPDPRTIYIAQIGWWLQKDVLDAIAAANSEATSVRDAPVKHLFKIAMKDPTFTALVNPMLRMNATGEMAAAPGEADPAVPVVHNYAVSATGRTTNPLYDVYRYSIKVNVEADQVARMLMELSRNKFITVTSVNLQAVDSGQMQLTGFHYGPKPVVQLDISCEALFLRQWTEPLMPPLIRTALGLDPPPGAVLQQ